MSIEKYTLIYNFGIFIIMVPVMFKAFHAFDLDKFFKRGFIWQKQVIYIVFVIITAKLFADTFSSIVTLIQQAI